MVNEMERPYKIMIVDDHFPTRLLATKVLESRGYEVLSLDNGEFAFQHFELFEPDVVLLDVLMPGVNGFSVCEQIRSSDKGNEIPIIMMTGLEDIDSIEKSFEVGATDFILKPLNCTLLKYRLRYIIRANNAINMLNSNLRQIETVAYYDSVSQLPNRDYFKKWTDFYLSKAKEENKKLAILFLDLDRFKRVNDTLGHSVGDELLNLVGKRLKESLRSSDLIVSPEQDVTFSPIISRFGGDEFAIILHDISNFKVIDKIVRRISLAFNQPFNLIDNSIYITTSIGISVYPDNGSDYETLLKNADIAMYYSKDFGRNSCHYFNSTMNSRGLEILSFESKLRTALEQEHFILNYQPKYTLDGKEITGVEILLRWEHPELGIVNPSDFIPTAEENGLIIPITEWIIGKIGALHDKLIKHNASPVIYAVNISAMHFKQVDFVDTMYKLIQRYQIPPNLIEFEITENILLDTHEWTSESIYNLQKYRIKLAIDDFGTGYSSLSYLKKFPINRLKIDRQFIDGVTNNPEDAAITRAIIAMANNLNIKVTAEGVETKEQLEYLAKLGCDEIQGFYYSLPLSENDFYHLLLKR